jgi:hypothetical protein
VIACILCSCDLALAAGTRHRTGYRHSSQGSLSLSCFCFAFSQYDSSAGGTCSGQIRSRSRPTQPYRFPSHLFPTAHPPSQSAASADPADTDIRASPTPSAQQQVGKHRPVSPPSRAARQPGLLVCSSSLLVLTRSDARAIRRSPPRIFRTTFIFGVDHSLCHDGTMSSFPQSWTSTVSHWQATNRGASSLWNQGREDPLPSEVVDYVIIGGGITGSLLVRQTGHTGRIG